MDVYETKQISGLIRNDLGDRQKTQFQHEDWGLMEPIQYKIDVRRALPGGREGTHIPVTVRSFLDSQNRLIRAAAKMTHLERLRILSIVEGNIFGWFEEQLCKYRPGVIEDIMMEFVDTLEYWANASSGAAFPLASESFTSLTYAWRRKDRKIVVLDRNYYGLKQTTARSMRDRILLERARTYKRSVERVRDLYFASNGSQLATDGHVLGSIQILWMPDEVLNAQFSDYRRVRIFQDRSPMSTAGYRYSIVFTEINDVLMDRLIMKIHGTVSDRSKYLPMPNTSSLLLESKERIDGIPVEALARTPIWVSISHYLKEKYHREVDIADVDVGFFIEQRFNLDFFCRLHDDEEDTTNMAGVEEIWMTIYRTDERHWGALLRKWACILGSRLHVFVELTASSEADRNFHLADDLMTLGADVKVAIPDDHYEKNAEVENFELKVHAKVLRMHTMDEKGVERDLLVTSTGNFSELAQSKFHDSYYMRYLPTTDGDPFPDATAFFEFLWTGKVNEDYKKKPFAERKMFFLPGQIRERVRQDIKGVTRIASAKEISQLVKDVEKALGKPEQEPEFDTQVIPCVDKMRPFIFIKTNHLTDGKVLKYLEKFLAENPTNTIYAIVRTTMGAENLLDYPNFICRTVLGSYLEHDRYFFTGVLGARTVESLFRDAKMDPEAAPTRTIGKDILVPVRDPNALAITSAYVMSADLMERNLSRRVECMTRLSPGMAEVMLMKMQGLFNVISQPKYGIFNESLNDSEVITEGSRYNVRKLCDLFGMSDDMGLY